MSTEGGTRAVVAALTANLAIAATKFGAWVLTGASSMLAEAIHSVADSGNQVLLLVGGKRARASATPQHPFGFGRERYIFAFLVAIVLFSVGGVFALYEAYHKYEEIQEGHGNELLDGRWWWVPLAVLAAAIVAEWLSFRTAIRGGQQDPRDGRASAASSSRAKAPELPVILLEDFAALLGLVFALFGVGLTLLTAQRAVRRHRHRDDRPAAGRRGHHAGLSRPRACCWGSRPAPRRSGGSRPRSPAPPGVERVIHMKTLHLGPEEILVAAKIAVPAAETAGEVAEAIDAAERAIREAEPMVTALYLEPDIFHVRPLPEHPPAPRPERRGSAPAH